MPALHSELAHNVAMPTLRKHLEQLLQTTAVSYADVIEDLKWNWEGDDLHFSFFAYGFAIAADVHLGPQRIEWDGHVPSRAAFVCSKIQRTIQGKLAEMVNGCYREAA